MKFVTVYKTGGDFDLEYVDRLHKTHPHNFICLSDDPNASGYVPLKNDYINHPLFKGWWAKMEMFRPDIAPGESIFYVDLDTIIVDNLYNELTQMKNRNYPLMLSDFYFPEKLASGIMFIPADVRELIWDHWIQDPIKHMSNNRGDQEFISETIGYMCKRFDQEYPDLICSYKAHISKQYPDHIQPYDVDVSKSKIICFHGKPRPKDVGWSLSLK